MSSFVKIWLFLKALGSEGSFFPPAVRNTSAPRENQSTFLALRGPVLEDEEEEPPAWKFGPALFSLSE